MNSEQNFQRFSESIKKWFFLHRHIAARQDQYAASVLLLARGAKVSEVNTAGETAVNCCTVDGDTMAALRLNAKVNELSEHMWEKTTRILTK